MSGGAGPNALDGPSAEVMDFENDAEAAKNIEVGRRRQVVGILVRLTRSCAARPRADHHLQMLQLGIMLHSLVIGLTLAITTGSEFSE